MQKVCVGSLGFVHECLCFLLPPSSTSHSLFPSQRRVTFSLYLSLSLTLSCLLLSLPVSVFSVSLTLALAFSLSSHSPLSLFLSLSLSLSLYLSTEIIPFGRNQIKSHLRIPETKNKQEQRNGKVQNSLVTIYLAHTHTHTQTHTHDTFTRFLKHTQHNTHTHTHTDTRSSCF